MSKAIIRNRPRNTFVNDQLSIRVQLYCMPVTWDVVAMIGWNLRELSPCLRLILPGCSSNYRHNLVKNLLYIRACLDTTAKRKRTCWSHVDKLIYSERKHMWFNRIWKSMTVEFHSCSRKSPIEYKSFLRLLLKAIWKFISFFI